MINVTKTYLPSREVINKHLDDIYESGYLTNNGPKLIELTQKLKEYLDIPQLDLVSNGTIAIQIAIQALDIKGEILTTPFSYVATLNSIIWEKCTPVFVDIERDTGNVDSAKIVEKISKRTKGMIFTHVYGNPCDVEAIKVISIEYNLPVIYDAAHAFGVSIEGKSVLNYGELSTLSFHATKVFHTVEGGAIVSKNPTVKERIELLKSFGHRAYDHKLCGINGKMSEVHAIFGLSVLDEYRLIVEKRRQNKNRYLKILDSLNIPTVRWHSKSTDNNAYMPILFKDEETLVKVLNKFEANSIYPRRYFYPSLNTLSYIDYQQCEESESFAKRVLCLPLYPDLSLNEIDEICKHLE